MERLINFYNSVSPLSKETWDELLLLFEPQWLQKNEHFIRENEVARKIAFLESGVVRAYFINEQGQEYNKQFFVAPASIGGYSSLLTGKPNLIAQQALTECKIYSCNFQSITALYSKYRDLERLARKMAEFYFIEKERKELEIVLLDALQRYRIFQRDFPTLEQTIQQFHIASYLGISATQLSRIRHQLSRST
jgi:CRP-like cAMP-binding protein